MDYRVFALEEFEVYPSPNDLQLERIVKNLLAKSFASVDEVVALQVMFSDGSSQESKVGSIKLRRIQ